MVTVSLWSCQVAATSCSGNLFWLSAVRGHIPVQPLCLPSQDQAGLCPCLGELAHLRPSELGLTGPSLTLTSCQLQEFCPLGLQK